MKISRNNSFHNNPRAATSFHIKRIQGLAKFEIMHKFPLLRFWSSIFVVALLSSCGRVQTAEAQKPIVKSVEPLLISKVVVSFNETSSMKFVNENQLYSEAWDTLAQPRFWKQIICLSPDSCIINIAKSRTPLQTYNYKSWLNQGEYARLTQKNDLRSNYNIENNEDLYVTSGKGEFYEHRKTIPTISKAVSYFNEFGVDPWYAQTILLIESPGKQTAKSSAGANGPFQLMKSVAMKYGLKVNKYVDERQDLKRAAYGASKLIGTICIPKVKGLLEAHNIPYNETDLWFRLLVMHAYHAGAGNLACAINKLNPTAGGQALIVQLWHTECGGFKNESQNYSQIALAAIMNFEEIVRANGDTVFLVQGDRAYNLYKHKMFDNETSQIIVKNCLDKYERDLVDGVIPFDYFIKKTEELRFELAILNGEPRKPETLLAVYPSNENHYIELGNELLRKRKVDDAIRLFKMNMINFPQSAAAIDSLSRAYRLNGSFGLNQKFMSKSGKNAR